MCIRDRLVTHISAATASLVWLIIEWLRFGKPSLVGLVTGTIAGLATITPASGFVGPMGGFILGIAGGFVCYYCVDLVKVKFNIDDSLDVFAVHGVGGATGTLLVAVLISPTFGGVGLGDGVTVIGQLGVQATGILATLVWCIVATVIIVNIARVITGFRVENDDEV